MKQIILLLVLIPISTFPQGFKDVKNNCEDVIKAVVETNVDLKSGEYVVYYKLVDLPNSYLDNWMNEYNLNNNIQCADTIIYNIGLQLIDDFTLKYYKDIADSLNRNIIDPFEETNKFQIIHDKTIKEYCEFSRPYFTNNGNYALIRFEVNSGFPIGSFARTYLMKIENGKWIVESIIEITED